MGVTCAQAGSSVDQGRRRAARRGVAVASLVSGDCIVSGSSIHRSLLFTGVRAHSYSMLDEAVILPGCHIGRGSRMLMLERLIDHMAAVPGVRFRDDDAVRYAARAVEPLNLLWLEDMITGDYVPFVNPDVYREVTRATSTPAAGSRCCASSRTSAAS